jgi:hypothetical protein
MADEHDGDRRNPWSLQGNRRLFLQRLATGGGVLIGSAADAASTKAPPARRTKTTETLPRIQTLTRATGKLAISSPVRMTTSTAPEETAPRPHPSPPTIVARQPSTRQRALSALSGAPGGAALLRSVGVQSGAGTGAFPFSGVLSTMMRRYTLAEAYAAGITLTPTGCQYSGGTYGGAEPLTYQTHRGWVNPVILGQEWGPDCCIYSETRERASYNPRFIVPLLTIDMITPGDPTQRMAYLLELHAPGFREDRVEVSIASEPINWSSTSDGTLVTTVELGGTSTGGRTGGAFCRRLNFQQRVDEPVHFYFCWLNAIAL